MLTLRSALRLASGSASCARPALSPQRKATVNSTQSPPPFGKVYGAPGAAQTPKTTELRSFQILKIPSQSTATHRTRVNPGPQCTQGSGKAPLHVCSGPGYTRALYVLGTRVHRALGPGHTHDPGIINRLHMGSALIEMAKQIENRKQIQPVEQRSKSNETNEDGPAKQNKAHQTF